MSYEKGKKTEPTYTSTNSNIKKILKNDSAIEALETQQTDMQAVRQTDGLTDRHAHRQSNTAKLTY